MIITKKIDSRQLKKCSDAMFYYVVTIIIDDQSNEIKICDDKTTVNLKVVQ